jgi:hypothetical protein
VALIWRAILSSEARDDILARPLITSAASVVVGASAGDAVASNRYEVHDCGCTVILEDGTFVLCIFHMGFEEGVLAITGAGKRRLRRRWGASARE